MKEAAVDTTETPSPLPWYVHLLVGHAFSGFFSWLLVIRQFWCRQSRISALLLFIVNTAILAGFAFASVRAKISWDYLITTMLALNLVWAVSAWLFQRLVLGAAPGRYDWRAWRSWLSPVTTAIVFAAGLAVLMAVIPVIGERIEVMYTDDVLDKKIILWDFFAYMPLLLPYALLVGLWWAGEGDSFSPSSVITYLCGLVVFFVVVMLVAMLFFFLLYKGQPYQGLQDWALMPPGTAGWRDFLVKLEQHDLMAYALAPLLLGTVTRFRDFWARSVLVFPVICLCLIPLSFYSGEVWAFAQGHIMHDMTSPDDRVRSGANHMAEVLLARYPEHENWPEFAVLLAKKHYDEREFEKARGMYGEIAARYKDSPRWALAADFAMSVLLSDRFGTDAEKHAIDLPLIDYESYLTPNWMALLQVIRYWDKERQAESEILIQLKSLSKSDEKIKLSPVPTLAELHDSASSLGFGVLILPTSYDAARSLLEADIPFILPIYSSFYLLNGFDDSRSLVTGYGYHRISERLRDGDWEAMREILFRDEEDRGKSLSQRRHIASQAYVEAPDSFWQSTLQVDSAPFMAVIYPDSERDAVASALSATWHELERESRGYLASLIALSALDAADLVQSIKWAMIGSELKQHPFPYQVAYLAERLWKTRESEAKSGLNLTARFPELSAVESFFDSSPVAAFLQEARHRFEADMAANSLSWIVRDEYADFLDRSNTEDLEVLISLARQNVAVNPGHRRAWLELAELYGWRDDVSLVIFALEGALQSGSWDDEIALLLAYRYAEAGNKEGLSGIMGKIDPAMAGQNPHYSFCRGVLADWNGKSGQAMKFMAKAIEMRRSDPLYHLRYGEVLLQSGRKEEARKALLWAIQIDVESGKVKEKAMMLLGQV